MKREGVPKPEEKKKNRTGMFKTLFAAAAFSMAPSVVPQLEPFSQEAFAGEIETDPHQRPTIEITIGGHRFRFILDTAHTITMVRPRVSEALGLQPLINPQTGEPYAPVIQGAAGPMRTHAVGLQQVIVDGNEIPNLLSVVGEDEDLGDADGILGVNAFHGWQLVFDFSRNEYHLVRDLNTQEYDSVPGARLEHTLLVVSGEVTVAGGRQEQVDFIPDTGGGRGVLGNTAFLEASGIRGERSQGVRGVGRESGQAQAFRVPSIQIGDLHANGIEGHTAPLSSFTNPTLVLGMATLRELAGGRSMVFDYTNPREPKLWFSRTRTAQN